MKRTMSTSPSFNRASPGWVRMYQFWIISTKTQARRPNCEPEGPACNRTREDLKIGFKFFQITKILISTQDWCKSKTQYKILSQPTRLDIICKILNQNPYFVEKNT